ncbi:hypothetical protein QFC24_006793 [Naganishia onofrii]|uniref:Uncharacterized protein n=1 Tax=Naganishia onofrii TaxID=1851511 RepID=A0ACC2WZP4_9TREE|nr:hypothetical protein QFC24_006793 [Naganishia onofrii]
MPRGKEFELVRRWAVWLEAAKANGHRKSDAERLEIVEGDLVLKFDKKTHGSLDHRYLQKVRLPEGIVVQKIVLVFGMTLFWNEYIAPKLDAADLKEVQKGIPILNTQDVINCSHSLGVFEFEGRPTTQENGPTAGVFFMAQNLLRRCRGIYTHINKNRTLVRPGSTTSDFRSRHLMHRNEMGTSKGHKEMMLDDG